MNEPPRAELEQSILLTQLIAAAIAIAVPVYVAVAWIVAPTMSVPSADERLITTMAVAMGALSIGLLAAAQLLGTNRLRSLTTLGDARRRLAGYRTTVVIAFALRESVAIFGLALALLGRDPRWALGFGAAALLSMLLGWPRRSDIEKLATTVQPIG